MTTPEAAGLNVDAVAKLLERVQREIDDGLLPACQVALAKDGKVALFESFGAADESSLFCMFSATKGITSAAAWLLIQDGKLSVDERVVDIVPEFGTNGKDVITVEQLFTHTAGFPHAPFRPTDWMDRGRRNERYAQWQLNWEPGSRFEYHPSSSMYVIAEIIERRSGESYTDFVREGVIERLGLESMFVGFEGEDTKRALDCVHVGEPLTDDEWRAMGQEPPPVTEVTEDAITNFNKPEVKAVGVAGGGGFTNAYDLALFYQGLLHGGLDEQIWTDATMALVRKIRSGDFKDPYMGMLANRGLGLIISGDKTRSFRGFR